MTRFVPFCLVGASGVVVDMGIVSLMAHLTPVPLAMGKAIACEVAIANNFLWNDRWTFRGQKGSSGSWRRFVRFNGTALAGLALNVALFQCLVRGVELNMYLANAVAIGLVAGFNYALSQRWVWGAHATQLRAIVWRK